MSQAIDTALIERGLDMVACYAAFLAGAVHCEEDAAALQAVVDFVERNREAPASADIERRELEAPATGEDVRERVVDEIIVALRTLCPEAGGSVAPAAYAAADRIIALLRTPRGEGEDSRLAPIVRAILERIDRYQAFHDRVGPADLTLPPVARTITEEEIFALRAALRSEAPGEAWRAFLDALDEFEAAANLWADPEGPTAADMERLRQSRQRVIECARALAALRSEAQEEARPRTSWGWMDYLECLLEDHVGAHDPATCCDVDDDEACCTTCALYRLHQRKPWRAAHPTDGSESDG